MKVQEAMQAAHIVYVGVEARTLKRKDSNGHTWFLVTARGQYFLVRPNKTAYKRVNRTVVDQWEDWVPQSDVEARKESDYMNSRKGLRCRNVILGLVMGNLPENMRAPDCLPEGW